MIKPTPEQTVQELLPKLRSDRLCLFPIRHHSPACALHVARWIDSQRPVSVLIEAPQAFASMVEHLVDPGLRCPVAFYTSFIDTAGRTLPPMPKEEADKLRKSFGPPRYSAFYPLCDYSPELVAIRKGHAAGARIRFIDLDYPEKLLARREPEDQQAVRIDSLTDDPHLRHSDYVRELGRRLHCRDFDELWDHVFEAGASSLSTNAFIDRVATWCAMARLEYSDAALQRDGTVAREACMASAIAEELKQVEQAGSPGPVLVVTGGFHTVALPDLIGKAKRPKRPRVESKDTGDWLIRYSFDQLDSLGGYASGMPNPAWYQQCWESLSQPGDDEGRSLWADLVVETARLSRERELPQPVSTPDAIAAVAQARQLANLRGHARPQREDVQDAIRSCFIKGELGTEGQPLLQIVRELFSGNAIGEVPPGTGAPPITDDFRKQAARLRLAVDSVAPKDVSLDLYRKTTHRETSRLFHRLLLLEVPFARFVQGPDFVHGHGLELLNEHWQTTWSPVVESALIEASVYGPTIEAAAGTRLGQQINQLDETADARSSSAAVRVLVQSCRMGLHAHTSQLIELIDRHIAEDPLLPSVAEAMGQLELLIHSREPLEARGLPALDRLVEAAWIRACRLIGEVAGCPDDMVDASIHALQTIREVKSSPRRDEPGAAELDHELFFAAMRRLVQAPPDQSQAALIGAAAGILFGEGKFEERELVGVMCGFLTGTGRDPSRTSGVMRGLLATAREAAWHVEGLLRALDETFANWDEDQFLEALPELRLAFADLTPGEVTRVADSVASLHGTESLGELIHAEFAEQDVHYGYALNRRVAELLAAEVAESDGEEQCDENE